MNIKDSILEANDTKIEVEDVPEWNCKVGIKVMTGTERDNFELSLYSEKGKTQKENLLNLRSRLLVKVIVDPETKKRVFKDKEAVDLGRKSSIVIDRLYALAQEINGLRKQDIEELTKNSEETQSEESILD